MSMHDIEDFVERGIRAVPSSPLPVEEKRNLIYTLSNIERFRVPSSVLPRTPIWIHCIAVHTLPNAPIFQNEECSQKRPCPVLPLNYKQGYERTWLLQTVPANPALKHIESVPRLAAMFRRQAIGFLYV